MLLLLLLSFHLRSHLRSVIADVIIADVIIADVITSEVSHCLRLQRVGDASTLGNIAQPREHFTAGYAAGMKH